MNSERVEYERVLKAYLENDFIAFKQLVTTDSTMMKTLLLRDITLFYRDSSIMYIQHLLERGFDINQCKNGMTPIFWAIGRGFKYLLDYGVNVDNGLLESCTTHPSRQQEAIMLLKTGMRLYNDPIEGERPWVAELREKISNCRRAAATTMGLFKRLPGSYQNIITMIGKAIWETRFDLVKI